MAEREQQGHSEARGPPVGTQPSLPSLPPSAGATPGALPLGQLGVFRKGARREGEGKWWRSPPARRAAMGPSQKPSPPERRGRGGKGPGRARTAPDSLSRRRPPRAGGGGRDAAGGKPGFSSLTAAEAGDSGYIRESSSVRWQYCGKVLPRYKKKDCYTQKRVYEKASPSASGPPSPWSAHGAVGMGTSVNSIAKLGCTPAQLSVQTAVCFKIIKS